MKFMSLLIVTLPPEPAANNALYDYVLSADGSTVDAHGCVPLAQLPRAPARAAPCVLVLPAPGWSWHRVQLPKGALGRGRAQTRLRTLLDGLLEEQLLDDPSQLHLALQPQPQAGEPTWVLACQRRWLVDGLQLLTDAGHVVTRIVPEFTLAQLQQNAYITEQADGARLVGLLMPANPDQAPGVLSTLLTPTSLALLAPPEGGSAIGLLAEPAVAALAEQVAGRAVPLLSRAQRLLQCAQHPWDLAQFDLAQRQRHPARGWRALTALLRAPAWRAARWSLAGLLLVHLVGLNALAWRTQQDLLAQRQQLRNILSETFPNIPVVVDAPVQMAREIAQMERSRGASADADLETMLMAFSAVAPTEYALDAIQFKANELRLQGPPVADAEVAAWQASLRARALQARLDGAQWVLSPIGKP